MSTRPEKVSNVQPVRSAVNGTSRRGPRWEELTWRVALPEEEETRKGRYSNPKKPNQIGGRGRVVVTHQLGYVIQAEQV